MRDGDDELTFTLSGLTGQEKTFREALKAILANMHRRGSDDDDDETLGVAVGIAVGSFPMTRRPLRGYLKKVTKRDVFDRPQVGKRPTSESVRQRTERDKVSRRVRFKIMERDGFRCRYCGVHVDDLQPGQRLQVDHVVAIARGGTSKRGNLVTACIDCNTGKYATSTKRFGE